MRLALPPSHDTKRSKLNQVVLHYYFPNCCYSAPQIGTEANDGDYESRPQGLQAAVSNVAAVRD